MTCVPAPACKAALEEATKRWPARNRGADGICASAQHHRQNPNSDHETGDAFDLTHDPAHGVDCAALVAELVDRRDPRVKYVIWDRTMWRSYAKPGIPAWTAAPYTVAGGDPHTGHMHVSIVHEARNVLGAWWLAGIDQEAHVPTDDERDRWLAEMHHELCNPKSATQLRLANIETNTAWIKQRLVDEQKERG